MKREDVREGKGRIRSSSTYYFFNGSVKLIFDSIFIIIIIIIIIIIMYIRMPTRQIRECSTFRVSIALKDIPSAKSVTVENDMHILGNLSKRSLV
jgi:hypothetical protein